MRYRGAFEGNLHDIFSSVGRAFSHGIWHCVGLAHANSDMAFAVANHHQSVEAEMAPTFDHLCHTGDSHHSLDERSVFAFYLLLISIKIICHLENQASLARGISQRFGPAVEFVAASIKNHCVDAFFLGALRDQFADQDRHLGLPLALALSEYRWFQTRRGDDRLAFGVVDDLNVNVLKTPIDGQSWPFGAAGNLTPHSFVSNDPSGLCGLGFRHLLGSPGALAWFDMDYFAGITDSLAGIHVGRPHLADFRRLLAYRLFVYSHDTNAVVAFNL